MGLVTGDKIGTQEEEDEFEEIGDFESQVSLNCLTHENKASTNMEIG